MNERIKKGSASFVRIRTFLWDSKPVEGWKYEVMNTWYVGLNENDPRWFICLDTYYPASGTVWKDQEVCQ